MPRNDAEPGLPRPNLRHAPTSAKKGRVSILASFALTVTTIAEEPQSCMDRRLEAYLFEAYFRFPHPSEILHRCKIPACILTRSLLFFFRNSDWTWDGDSRTD